MSPDEIRAARDAYLDGQLDSTRAAEVENALNAHPELKLEFDRQREFYEFVRRQSVATGAPTGLREKLRSRLSQEIAAPAQAAPVFSAPRRASPRQWFWIKAAAILMMAGGVIVWYSLLRECPYMVACAGAHAAALNDPNSLAVRGEDPAKLVAYVSEKSGTKVTQLPEVSAMKPMGAGIARFASLGSAPPGVFVRYDQTGAEPVTMIFHPWPSETPLSMNLKAYKGLQFWLARHGEYSVAAWKSADGKLLCSLISKRPRDEVLEMASQARAVLASSMSSMEPPSIASFAYAHPR